MLTELKSTENYGMNEGGIGLGDFASSLYRRGAFSYVLVNKTVPGKSNG